jgi:hypothetical protein
MKNCIEIIFKAFLCILHPYAGCVASEEGGGGEHFGKRDLPVGLTERHAKKSKQRKGSHLRWNRIPFVWMSLILGQ